jgi:glycosyltransferase involved in cell wall biosynthesis
MIHFLNFRGTMRVAVIHEWLVTYAGSERVFEQILACYPDADVFCIVDFLPEKERQFLKGKNITTSFIQKLPKAATQFRNYLPLMPLAVEQFDVSGYDLVISSSHAVSKGVLTGPDQLHVSYVHSPIRYAWDLQHQYLEESGLMTGPKSWMARSILHYMRLWDVRTAYGVNEFVANSAFIARRIRKVYGREASVIYPPVDITAFTFKKQKDDFYLAASRMVPYKRMPMIVEAFACMPDKQLIVIGEGPELEKCRSVSASNVDILGWQPFDVLRDHMQRAKAFVFAAEEDFGITPVEAQACGTPVIAYGKGGVLETVIQDTIGKCAPTGIFYSEQTISSLQEAVKYFEQSISNYDPAFCRENALRFSCERFKVEFTRFVTSAWNAFNKP